MSLTPNQLRTHAEKALLAAHGSNTLAYAWPQDWAGGDSISLSGREVPVRHCRSPLEIGEALAETCSGPRILLVAVPETQLSSDVLARVARHRLLQINPWEVVQDALGVQLIDPRLYSLTWLPNALLATTSTRRSGSGPALTYDEAMELCLRPVLGIQGPIDLDRLLAVCESAVPAWMALSPEQQNVFRHYLISTRGPLAGLLLATMETGHGAVAVAIGIACEVLFAETTPPVVELRLARARLEERLRQQRISEMQGRQWAELSCRLVLSRPQGSNHRDFRLAADLLDSIAAMPYAALGTVLPESLDHRLDNLADAVAQFLRHVDQLPEVEASAQRVLEHRAASADHPGRDSARMLVRLCRHEALASNSDAASDPVATYLADGAWEDWARRSMRAARPEKLARVVTRLLDRVAVRRVAADGRFAQRLVDALALGDCPAGVLPIENSLATILAPLAERHPVLLIVLDGMSQDVYLPIAEAMAERGWNAWKPVGVADALLATVPSVTECSRASLFAGRLVRGVASQERQEFSRHAPLLRASRAGKPPMLLHKAALENSHQLTSEAASAIADEDQQVVAVVINAIDDALAKSDQIRIAWTLETIPLLAEVLEHARRAGRAVMLTSDHGHVLERQSALAGEGDGERWRTVGLRPIGEGELLVRGPRVEGLVGHPVIAPFDERIRYGIKKNGYHGGICAQELLVPYGIWTASGEAPSPAERYQPSVRSAPGWWLDGAPAVGALPAVTSATVRKPRTVTPARDDLFGQQPADNWLDQLMQSALLRRQQERAGRMALEPERLRAMLAKLQQQGDRASIEQLAAAISQPLLRMRGIVSMMERLLNVDGYLVITLEQATGTVMLDVPLLKKQFLA